MEDGRVGSKCDARGKRGCGAIRFSTSSIDNKAVKKLFFVLFCCELLNNSFNFQLSLSSKDIYLLSSAAHSFHKI